MPQRYSLSNTNNSIETITTPNHEGNFCMSPLQNGNTAPQSSSAGDFYIPSSRESTVIPSTHSIGEEMPRSDLVSTAATAAIDAAAAGESAIPQSVLSQDHEKIVADFVADMEKNKTGEDLSQFVNMAHRIDHFRKTVPVKV